VPWLDTLDIFEVVGDDVIVVEDYRTMPALSELDLPTLSELDLMVEAVSPREGSVTPRVVPIRRTRRL
jgi:hypothetical protein